MSAAILLTNVLQELVRGVKDDDVSPETIVDLLKCVAEPTAMPSNAIKFANVAGYRLVDVKLMQTALVASQKCHHGTFVNFIRIDAV